MKLLMTVFGMMAFLFGAPLYAQRPAESPAEPERDQADKGSSGRTKIMRILFSRRSLLLAFGALLLSTASFAQIGVAVAVTFAPPELPVYEQPLCPGDGYMWIPGYWAWGDDDYFWVPGTWVLAPEPGFFWTPGYWAWGGSGFFFNEGYWGPVVGFYGGINYGFGYFGHGYEGGRWTNGRFYYNRSVNNINVTEIHNVYDTRVVNNTAVARVSYNGGQGGIKERPTSAEQAAAHQRHISPVPAQIQHLQAARTDQSLRASANHGKPPIAATPKPASFSDRGIVAAKEGGHYNPPARPEGNSARAITPVHPSELPPAARPAAPNTGNTKLDQKYQQQQQKLQAQQDRERQKLQQKQDQEHQQLAKKSADDARKQQVEQKHQQQTQQLAQKHAQQQQKLQTRQNPPRQSAPQPAPRGKP
jgi:WXXGXW repeat (2 copies)